MPALKKPLPKAKFVKSNGSRVHKGDVQSIGALVWKMAETHGVNFHATPLTPLLEHARNPKSPLHKYIEWNDGEAAEKYRLEQVRKIILSIDVIYLGRKGEEIRSPANVSVSVEGQSRVVYAPAPIAWGEKELANQVKVRAKRTLDTWVREYETCKFLASQVQAAKVILQTL